MNNNVNKIQEKGITFIKLNKPSTTFDNTYNKQITDS